MCEEPDSEISNDALKYYKKLSSDIYHNQIYNIKELADDELDPLSNRIFNNYKLNYNSIVSIYSFIDKLEIQINNPRMQKEIYLNQENNQESFDLLDGNIKIIITYLNTHKINLSYKVLNDRIYTNEKNKFDKYSVDFNKISNSKDKSQDIDLSKDHEKFIDFLDEDKVKTIYFCFRCEYILNENEIWSFQKRREISKLLPQSPPSEFIEFLYKMFHPYLDGFAKNIYRKLPKEINFDLAEIKNILFIKIINSSLKNKNALILFEHIENEDEFRSFIIAILKKQTKIDIFLRPFIKKNEEEVMERIIKQREKEVHLYPNFENSIINIYKFKDIYKCLSNASKKIENKNRRIITKLYLKGYPLKEIYNKIFPNMNRNTFDAHKHYGVRMIRNECMKLYKEWR